MTAEFVRNRITPQEFFDDSWGNPAFIQTAIDELKKLGEDDISLVIDLMRRLPKK